MINSGNQTNLQSINQFMKSTLEDELLSNAIPYPEYYDGNRWNTLIVNSRRHIPQYLKEELPKKKFHRIKSKFQQMNRFAPPQISFFQKLISKTQPTKKSLTSCRRKAVSKVEKVEHNLKSLKEQMQYALMMSSRQSNVLVNLMQKASKLERISRTIDFNPQKTFKEKVLESKVSRRSRIGFSTKKCFSNTDDVVFTFRKKQYIEKMKSTTSAFLPNQDQQNRIDSIRLKTFSAENNTIR